MKRKKHQHNCQIEKGTYVIFVELFNDMNVVISHDCLRKEKMIQIFWEK